MPKFLCYFNLILLAGCAGKPLVVTDQLPKTPASNPKADEQAGSAQKATIEIVHPKEVAERLKGFKLTTAKISFELIKTFSYAQAGDQSSQPSGSVKIRNSAVDEYGEGKVTRIENITPGRYSHLSIWIDYLNESAFYSGNKMGDGIDLKPGQTLRIGSLRYLSIAEAECEGQEKSSRLTFYAEKHANCKKPPIDPENVACIALAKPRATSCFIQETLQRCSVLAAGKPYDLTISTTQCSDPEGELIRRLCFDNVTITKDELSALSCSDISSN